MRRMLFGAVAFALVAAPSAGAASVQSGSGGLLLSPPSQILDLDFAGPNVLATESGTLAFDTGGTISGSGTITVTAVDHPQIGETFTAEWVGEAVVNGQSGELDFHFEGKDNGTFTASFTVDGSGGLAGFHGQGELTGQDASGIGSYTLSYHG